MTDCGLKKVMMGKVYTAAIIGIEGKQVMVETDIGDGLPYFDMVGYLGSEVKEARERVRTAIKNAGFRLPPSRITVNLSPADVRKQGNHFDLPIAMSVLAAAGFVPREMLENVMFIGELGLEGDIRPVNGTLSLVQCAGDCGMKAVFLPEANAAEGANLENIPVYGFSSLSGLVEALVCDSLPEPAAPGSPKDEGDGDEIPDFSELRGQETLRRASLIAAAGMHNLLLIGPPGSGKTMAAKRIPGIMPPMTRNEEIELTKIYSVSGLLPKDSPIMTRRPIRSPHHTISAQSLAGGGAFPRPGEISLAHRGILFLDELPEFRRGTLEVMRQPIEDGRVVINRVQGSYVFPASFMLVAAMNPCPCGFYPDRSQCRCTEGEIKRYLDRISQPLLDRIDLCAEAGRINYDDLTGKAGESSASMRGKVEAALERQKARYKGTSIRTNAQLSEKDLEKYCPLGREGSLLLKKAYDSLGLSARARGRIIKTARTIADLEESAEIRTEHLAEAVTFRSIDKKYWGR